MATTALLNIREVSQLTRLSIDTVQRNTVPALVGFAFGIADCPGIARIGNGLFCRAGRRA